MLREIFVELGFGMAPGGFQHVEKQTEKLKHKAHETGESFEEFAEKIGGLAGILTAGLLGEGIEKIEEEAVEIGNLSTATGLSTDEFQAWSLGAKQAGVDAEGLARGLRKLSVELAGGKDEMGQQTALFQKMGISTHDAQTKAVKPLGELLPEIAEHFKGLKNETQSVALAQELFGRNGARMLPILRQGADGVDNLRTELKELGGGFSEEAIERAHEFHKETVRLTVAFDSFKTLVALNVFPVLSATADKMTELTVGFKKWTDGTTAGAHAIEILAGLLAVKLASALAPYLGTGLKFAAIFLAVDDLLAFLEGKDSVIGDLLNRAFGDGTATQVRAWADDSIDSFGGWLDGFKAVLPDIGAAFEQEFASAKLGWDEMLLGFEHGWNDFIGSLHLPDGLKFGDKTIFSRKNDINADKAGIAAADAHRAQTTQAVQNYASAITPLSGQGAAAPQGPLRAPVITQNFVEVKPNISITVPPGTSPAHAQRLVREAAAGTVSHERRVAMQAVDKRGGE